MSVETQTKPKMRRSTRILLIVSLTLNFLVAGVVVGGAVAHWRSPDDHRGRIFGFSSPYTRALSFEDRRAIGKSIRGHYRSRGPEHRNRGRDKAQVREAVVLLRASPLNVEALATLLEQQGSMTQSRQQIAQEFWLKHVQTLGDEDRAAYADRLEVILNEPRRGRRRKDN